MTEGRRLEGRKAIITGGNTGIGKATAQRLAAEGASVCINFFADRDRAGSEALARDLESAGAPKAIAVQADVGDEHAVVAMVAQTASELGGVDLLVNNAGIEKLIPLLEMSLTDWDAVLRTNLTGAFLCLREAGKVMVQSGSGGVIVNMSSVHQHIPWPGFAHYCASKGGIKLLMETAAKELAVHKIRLVNIAPGAIATPINANVLADKAQVKAVIGEIPLARFGQPEEIAAAVAWVASDEASYVTGATFVIDGGMSLYPNFI